MTIFALFTSIQSIINECMSLFNLEIGDSRSIDSRKWSQRKFKMAKAYNLD